MRWKIQVLYSIHLGQDSFGALKRQLPAISDHILGKRLRELAREGLVRKDRRDRHPTYAVTPRGEALLDIMRQICAWELQGYDHG